MDKKGKIAWWVPLVIILPIALGILYLYTSTAVFVPKNIYYAVYDNVDGVGTSADVQVKGFTIGQIHTIDILPNSSATKIVVTFTIEDPKHQIPYGSIVEIASTDILSGSVLVIQYNDTSAYHSYGDTLSSSPEVDLEKSVANTLAPIKIKTDNLQLAFDSTASIFKSLKDDAKREKLLASFDGMKRLMISVDQLSAKFSAAAANEKWRIARIEQSIDSIKFNLELSDTVISNILVNYNLIQDSLAKGNVEKIILTSNKALAEVNNIMKKINSGEGTIGLLINNDELTTLLAQANTDFQLLLLDYDKHPERYVNVSLFSKRNRKSDDHFLTKENRETLKRILEGKKNGNK